MSAWKYQKDKCTDENVHEIKKQKEDGVPAKMEVQTQVSVYMYRLSEVEVTFVSNCWVEAEVTIKIN